MIEPVVSFVRANGLAHRVLTWGEAPGRPIVLAHGYLDHAWSFHFLAQHLVRAGHRVIAFDWRGHGETERVGPGGYYHFPDYVLDLAELVPKIAGETYHLVGHSMGGTACAMFAGTRPYGLGALVLCEGLGPPDTSTDPSAFAWRLTDFLASVARARSGPGPRPMPSLDEAIGRMRLQHPTIPDAEARFLAEKGTRPEGEGLVWCFDPLHRTTAPMPFRAEAFMAVLAQIEVSVLSVRGADGFKTVDHDARLASIRVAREVVLEGVGHMMHWQAPEALAAAILSHVDPRRREG